MAYITLDEAKQFLSTIYVSAYQNENTEIPDDSILQEDIDAMTALIDSYIKRSYDQVIVGVSKTIFKYDLRISLSERKYRYS